MRRNRKAKIVATLGPASSSESVIRELFVAGVDVFRLNFSHGSHADHKERVRVIRGIETEFDHPVGILMDIQGPKLRLGNFINDTVTLSQGEIYRLDLSPEAGDQQRAPLPHPEIFAALEGGQ